MSGFGDPLDCGYEECIGCSGCRDAQQRLLQDKQALLKENITLRKELLQLQKEHLQLLQAFNSSQQLEQQHKQATPPSPGPSPQVQYEELQQSAPNPSALEVPVQQQLLTCDQYRRRYGPQQHSGYSQQLYATRSYNSMSESGAREPCKSPCLSSGRLASRLPVQQSTAPRQTTKLHSSFQKLGALIGARSSWVGSLKRSLSNSKSLSSNSGLLGDASLDSTSLDSTGAQGSSRNVVDVGLLTGLTRQASTAARSDAISNSSQSSLQLPLQRRCSSSRSMGGSSSSLAVSGEAAAAQRTVPQLLSPHTGRPPAAPAACKAVREDSTGSWRVKRPAPLTYLRPAALLAAAGREGLPTTTSGGDGCGASPAGSPVGATTAATRLGTCGVSVGCGPLTCPAAVLCSSPWGSTPVTASNHYSSNNSSSSSSGGGTGNSSISRCSSGDDLAPAAVPEGPELQQTAAGSLNSLSRVTYAQGQQQMCVVQQRSSTQYDAAGGQQPCTATSTAGSSFNIELHDACKLEAQGPARQQDTWTSAARTRNIPVAKSQAYRYLPVETCANCSSHVAQASADVSTSLVVKCDLCSVSSTCSASSSNASASTSSYSSTSTSPGSEQGVAAQEDLQSNGAKTYCNISSSDSISCGTAAGPSCHTRILSHNMAQRPEAEAVDAVDYDVISPGNATIIGLDGIPCGDHSPKVDGIPYCKVQHMRSTSDITPANLRVDATVP